uniref:Peptidase M13 C-terminal domain-containing protein n=1 Tax=Parascaris equorum TaxID=6256 RepID=A0A914RFA7_PAREQ
MIALELYIAYNLTTDDTTRRKFARSYNRYSTLKASQEFPFLDWSIYLRQLSTYAPSDVQAKMKRNDFEFLIEEPTMLAKLDSYLSSGRYSARTIQKSPMEFDVSARRREPWSIIRPLPEWRALTSYDNQCASFTIGDLPYANARVFLDTMYPMRNDRIVFRQKFADFMESVLISFRSMVDHLSWMSIKSKEGAYSKIDDLTKNIAYPDFITDDKLLTQYYAALDIEPEVNSITFPLGILQQPFYDPNWPSSMNYGAMGVVVGHELTHGFDDQGIQWDGTGVLYEWMDSSSFASFEVGSHFF